MTGRAVLSRRRLLSGMGLASIGLPIPRPSRSETGNAGLGVMAREAGLVFGCAATSDQLTRDPSFAATIAEECGVLVTELDLKWAFLSPEPGHYRFAGADTMLDFAEERGMAFRGHTLVWHGALPNWVALLENGARAAAMTQHIRTVMARYRGRIGSWDVVNEPLDPDVSAPDGLRRSGWLTGLGPDYIAAAFQIAGQTDPDAKLVLNEYGLVFQTDYARARRRHMLALVDRILSFPAPLHAVGLQCHLSLADPAIDKPGLADFAAELADRGVALLVTELDVDDRAGPFDRPTRDRLVAARYAELLDAVMSLPRLEAVVTWGLADRHTWLRHDRTHPFAHDTRPLPLDAELNRKPVWTVLANAFANRHDQGDL